MTDMSGSALQVYRRRHNLTAATLREHYQRNTGKRHAQGYAAMGECCTNYVTSDGSLNPACLGLEASVSPTVLHPSFVRSIILFAYFG